MLHEVIRNCTMWLNKPVRVFWLCYYFSVMVMHKWTCVLSEACFAASKSIRSVCCMFSWLNEAFVIYSNGDFKVNNYTTDIGCLRWFVLMWSTGHWEMDQQVQSAASPYLHTRLVCMRTNTHTHTAMPLLFSAAQKYFIYVFICSQRIQVWCRTQLFN